MWARLSILAGLLAGVAAAALVIGGILVFAPEPGAVSTPAPLPSASLPPEPTATPSVSSSPTPSLMPSVTASPTPSLSPSPSAGVSGSPTSSGSPNPSASAAAFRVGDPAPALVVPQLPGVEVGS